MEKKKWIKEEMKEKEEKQMCVNMEKEKGLKESYRERKKGNRERKRK